MRAPAKPAEGFAAKAREDATSRLSAQGLPGRRDEYWRMTDPRGFTADAPRASAPLRVERPIFTGLDKLRLVFVDGVFDVEASDPGALDPGALDGVEITRLAEAGAGGWAEDLYGTLEAAGQVPVARPLATRNTARATDGLLIRVTGRPSRPLHISYRQSSHTSDVMLHHCIRLEPGARLTLLETGTAGARSDIVTEVDAADGAQFHHVRPQGRAAGRQVATHLFARIGEGALVKSFTLALDGILTRNEAVMTLMGDGGTAHVAGLALGDGDMHHDDTVFITHEGLGCESRQVFKKVLRNGATGVFQGKILVRAAAQKTDGYQLSQALMLDDDSQFLAKPELEIYADDVKCSHGSTTGAIDETALFYLRSRGVPRREAEALLVLSFLAEALAEIEDESLLPDLIARLEDWLAEHADLAPGQGAMALEEPDGAGRTENASGAEGHRDV